jgi:hypothetical protein
VGQQRRTKQMLATRSGDMFNLYERMDGKGLVNRMGY